MLRPTILLLFAWLNCLFIAGQNLNFRFSHLDISRGLSNNQVTCFFKDQRGFLWIGTMSGLNRYDGYGFKIFRQNIPDTTSLSDDFISRIKECPEGKMWVETRGGINIYDPVTEKFDRNVAAYLRKVGLPSNSNVSNLIKDKEDNFLFLINNQTIYKYVASTRKISRLYNSDDASNTIAAISADNSNQYWLIHYNGFVKKIDSKTGRALAQTDILTKVFAKGTMNYELFIDNDNELWISKLADLGGLVRYNPSTGKYIHYQKNSGYPRLNSDLVSDVEQDNGGNIWICTDHGGINLYNKKQNSIQYLLNNVDDEKSLSQNSITTAYKDNAGIIWLGTFKKGINYYHENIIKFPVYRHQPSNPNSLGFEDVNCFVEDAKGNLWIGTNGGGLIYFDRAKNKFAQYLHQSGNKNSISNNVVVSLLVDHKQRLWIGTYFGGLNCLENGRFTHYRNDPSNPASLSDDRVWEIFEDSKKHLWIGTFEGLNKFDEQHGEFYHYTTNSPKPLNSNFIGVIMEESQGKLWLGTFSGIDILDILTGEITHKDNYTNNPHGLSNNNITALFKGSRGLIWVGTRDGLNVYKSKNDFQSFHQENGLPDKSILDILEDNNGRLWISTKKGVSQVSVSRTNNPDAPIAIACSNYDELDGLQGAEFNEKAALKTSKGEIVFGGPNGFNLFNPMDIVPDKSTPHLVFTDLQLFNRSVGIGEKINNRVVLPQSISNTSSITLRYNEDILALEFAALNFYNPEKIKYAYRLDGFNKDWLTTDGKMRKAIYTNLDPGDYTFRLKASYTNGEWSDKELTLKIIILPPFWRTPLAYALYVLVLATSLFIARKIIVDRTRMRFEVEHQRKEAERVQALDAMKTKFFTNVSHEFRTPLTLILSPLEKIIKQIPNEEQKNQLNLVQRNAKRLLSLVNQLLDFRKMEVQEVKLHPAIGDIIPFIRDISHSFTDIAEKKKIRFSFSSNIDSLEIYFDKDKIEKILFNLLSNAFKYTPDNGEVSVNLIYNEPANDESDRTLAIKIKDTGIGIPADKHEKIFERFFQTDVPESMVNQGTGIGLAITKEFVRLHNGIITVKSEPEKGTCFTVLLPAKKIYDFSTRSVSSAILDDTESSILEESQKNGKRKTIVIVEDNEDLRFYLKDNLKGQYHVEEATNGKEGWEKIKQLNPDLIVSDIMMPLMDGVELARKVKTETLTAHIPIILLSAMGSEEKQLEGLSVGVNDYITKPFTFEILASKIRNLIAQQKLLQKRFQTQIEVNPSEITVTPVDEKFLKQALEIVEKHIDQPEFSVEDFSREMFMNRVTLYRKILSITGKTPLEFIRSIRLKRAAQLLEKSGMSVAEIAYEVGFNNPKTFSKFFKEEFNMLPSQYAATKKERGI